MKKEAMILAEKINIARFENRIPEAEDTIRLTEILDKLLSEEDAAQETTKKKKFGRFTVVLEIESDSRSECDIWLGNNSINMVIVECGGSVWENETTTLLLDQILESGLSKEMIAWAYSEGY